MSAVFDLGKMREEGLTFRQMSDQTGWSVSYLQRMITLNPDRKVEARKQRPLGQTARDVELDLSALSRRIEKLTADPRLARSREEIAGRLLHTVTTSLVTLKTLQENLKENTDDYDY